MIVELGHFTLILALLPALAGAQHRYEVPDTLEAIHRPFDELLDSNVRDGMVYYRALQSMRSRLDRYVASLDVSEAAYESWTRERQIAFWLNAYNAFVLKTVVDRYPIRGRSDAYPASSIRQIPGAFDKLRHRAAGRSVTLDEIGGSALYLLSDLGSGVTGEVINVDSGYNVVSMPTIDELKQSDADRP